MKRWLLLAVLLGFGAWQWWGSRAIEHGPGETAAADPVQRELSVEPPHFEKHGYTVTPLASFDITARVLGVEHYHVGREADLSPLDFALGWGPMSDSAVLSKIDISQSGRFYYWHVDEFPIPRAQIETHSANMHLIPADAAVEQQLDQVRPGSLVTLSGYLVEARAGDGWHWRSSLTRNDTGNGACELVWVERIEAR
jgi:hypothetical protein